VRGPRAEIGSRLFAARNIVDAGRFVISATTIISGSHGLVRTAADGSPDFLIAALQYRSPSLIQEHAARSST